jgi:hypothetical protein
MQMTIPNALDQENMVALIRVHANTNYNKGWDAIVEGFEDDEILEYLENADFDMRKAISALQEFVTLRLERMEDTGGY